MVHLVGDLINWAKICSDGASIAEGGDETIVPMTSDDPEVQDEVRHIIKKILESQVAWQTKNRCKVTERDHTRH